MIYTCQHTIYKLKYGLFVDIVVKNDLSLLGFGWKSMYLKAWDNIGREIEELSDTKEREFREDVKERIKKKQDRALMILCAGELLRLHQTDEQLSVGMNLLSKCRVCGKDESIERAYKLAESTLDGLKRNIDELEDLIKTEDGKKPTKKDYIEELAAISTKFPVNLQSTVAEVVAAKNTFILMNKPKPDGTQHN